MNRKSLGKWIGIFSVVGAGIALLNLSSCARNQELIGITVSPPSFTFLVINSNLVADFTATGTYIHPAESKDITAEVTWSVDVPQMLNMNGGAVTTTGQVCGVANISASYDKGTGPSGNVVTGYATVTVDDPNVSYCPGGTSAPVLGVQIQQTTTSGNSVTSDPAGINCPAQTCGAPFTSGTTVSLIAAPSSNFLSWGSPCQGSTSTTCDVVLTTSTTVTATFK